MSKTELQIKKIDHRVSNCHHVNKNIVLKDREIKSLKI